MNGIGQLSMGLNILLNKMKRITVKRHNQPKILHQEAEKLKEKLEHLKKQIQAKKKEKEIGRGQTTGQISLAQSRKSNLSRNQLQPDLMQALKELKLETLAAKLIKKQIVSLQQLKAISEEELDNWKDIAVGYRIKIKKYLKTFECPAESTQQKASLRVSPQKHRKEERNIEDIIKGRKQEQIYVPIKRKQEEEYYDEEIGEEEQEIMIQSLLKAFKGQPETNSKEIVEPEEQYDSEEGSLQEVRYEKPSESVKIITFQTQTAWEGQTYPDYKYCWICLNMINTLKNLTLNKREFCCENCLQRYKNSFQISEQNPFYSQISAVEDQFNDYLTMKEGNKKINEMAGGRRKDVWAEQEQEVDFEIV